MLKLLTGAAVALALLIAPAQAAAKKIALVLPGPITDGTFNSAANKGIEAAKAKYDIEVVDPREHRLRANRGRAALLRRGRLRHGHRPWLPVRRAGHEDPCATIPKTWFVVNTAQVSAEPNVASFDNRWGDAGYIAGAVAALYTKTGTIGHIGGIPVPVIEDYNKGFETGAKHFKPDVKVLSAYVGSFSDIARGAEITTSLIEQGADVVTSTGNENVVGTIQAAQKAKVHAIGTAFDSQAMAPETIITTALINMDVNIDLAIGRLIDGTLKPETYVLGLNEGGIGLAPFTTSRRSSGRRISPRSTQLMQDIRDGKITDLP